MTITTSPYNIIILSINNYCQLLAGLFLVHACMCIDEYTYYTYVSDIDMVTKLGNVSFHIHL